MIHNAECHIHIKGGLPIFTGGRVPIPTDAQIQDVFPEWNLRAQEFVLRCCEEDGKRIEQLTATEFFKYGMKFMIVEAAKL